MPDPLLDHCLNLAAASPDGTFPLGKVAAADVLDTHPNAGERAVYALFVAGLIVRVRPGDAKNAPVYAIAGTAAAAAALVPVEPDRVTCSVCGRRYIASGGVDGCPGFLSHPAVRAAWHREVA